jgi:hypothetical protein
MSDISVRIVEDCATFDEEKLRNFIYKNGGEGKYLVMNEDTFHRLKVSNIHSESIFNGPKYILGYHTYMGIPIALCNRLGFGVVELV